MQQARLCPALSLAGRHPGCARCRGEARCPRPTPAVRCQRPQGPDWEQQRRERQPCPASLAPSPRPGWFRSLKPALRLSAGGLRGGAGEAGRSKGVASQISGPVSLAVLTRRLSARGIEGEDLRRGASGKTEGFQATTDGNASSRWVVGRFGSAPSRHAPTTPTRQVPPGAGSQPLSAPPAVSSD